MQQCDLVIFGDFILPMTDSLPVIEKGAVAILGNSIVEVGLASEIEKQWQAKERLEGGIVIPGLVNTHGHAAMTLYRGLGDNLPVQEWLSRFIWPAEKQFSTEINITLGTELALCEMIASGTTTFADMYFFQSQVAEASQKAGVRALLAQGVVDFPMPGCSGAQEAIALTKKLVDTWDSSELINFSIGLHSIYALSPELLSEGTEMAGKLGIPIQVHVSESRKEVEECLSRYKMTPAALLKKTGVLREGTICAHGVHLTDEDMCLIADVGSGVSLNLDSNLKLGSGIPRIVQMLNSGMLLGLGTDGAASNNTLDLWNAIRLAALLPKGIAQDPTAISAKQVISLATRGGAELLGLGDKVGTLEVGKRADICVIDLNSVSLTPCYSPWAHLAYAARGSDVIHTVINGQVVYRDRSHLTLDRERIRADVVSLAKQIGKELKSSF